jgi:hypothetical protein
MALIHPKDVSFFDDASGRERRVFNFLGESAKPDRHFICWYRPSIRGAEPLFVLLSKTQGFLVIEVTDLAIHEMKEGDPHTITVFI